MAHDEDEYFVPRDDQRVFGAGIKRKRVPFVPASDLSTTTVSAPPTASSSPAPPCSIGDRYLSIVLPASQPATPVSSGPALTTPTVRDLEPKLCEVCSLPLKATTDGGGNENNDDNDDNGDINEGGPRQVHESSLAHQVCLPHSHPPSAIDRRRTGYKYLSSLGWDPDSRSGLGPAGHGIREPLKGKIKNDTIGLGVKVSEREVKKRREPIPKLDAKQVRKKEAESKQRGEKLREMFYRAEDIERYLGQ